jgi:hypothetical protein
MVSARSAEVEKNTPTPDAEVVKEAEVPGVILEPVNTGTSLLLLDNKNIPTEDLTPVTGTVPVTVTEPPDIILLVNIVVGSVLEKFTKGVTGTPPIVVCVKFCEPSVANNPIAVVTITNPPYGITNVNEYVDKSLNAESVPI